MFWTAYEEMKRRNLDGKKIILQENREINYYYNAIGVKIIQYKQQNTLVQLFHLLLYLHCLIIINQVKFEVA